MSTAGIFIRGVLMGAADIVPGVSGGTVAFITGIYGRLLGSLRAFDINCIKRVMQGDIKGAWRHVDGNFLLPLVLGIATSIFTLARGISWVLVNYPVPLWSFFFGLILASALILLRQIDVWSMDRLICLLLGSGIALWTALSPVLGVNAGLWGIFFSGFLAICAMILPGISGSFILVLLGMYGTVLAAVKNLDIDIILVFIAGAAAGLMVFSRILYWLLQRFHEATMAMLTGFLFGSLAVVWPWKRVLDWVVDSHGQLKAAQQVPVFPQHYQEVTGHDPLVLLCVVLMVSGFLCLWLIESKWGGARLEL